jgi:ribonuclease HII
MAQRLNGIAGVDEAGRGPMIGPMVVCGVLVTPETLHDIAAIGSRDSKMLSPRRRSELSVAIRQIAKRIEIKTVSAADIDVLRKKMTLNELEVHLFASILKELKPQQAYLDAADVKADRFGENIGKKSGLLSMGCKIISEHKADAKYPIVSAASIIAKVERDSAIEELHHEYGDFGSGYPSDPRSVEFVKGYILEGKQLPPFVRCSWESVSKLIDKYSTRQTRLG